jgi:hypothetical protein
MICPGTLRRPRERRDSDTAEGLCAAMAPADRYGALPSAHRADGRHCHAGMDGIPGSPQPRLRHEADAVQPQMLFVGG